MAALSLPTPFKMEIPSVDSSNASVGLTVDSLEDYSPVSHWDKWPEDARCHITQQPPLPGQFSLLGRKT
jgi:hypothetical protein